MVSGPERLEAGPPSPRGPRPRGRWLLPAAGAVLLGGLLAARVGELPGLPTPAPRPPTSSPYASAPPGQPGSSEPDVPGRAWPADLRAGTGTLYLTSGRSVLAVDASTGLVTDTGVRTRSYDVRLAPLADGLLVWYPSGWSSRLLRFGLDTGTPPPGALARANRFVPGAAGVWAAQVDPARPDRRTVWRLVEADGTATTSVAVRGRAVADGAGGLLAVAGGTVRVVEPPLPAAADRQADPGAVVATGPDGFLVQRCSGGACTTVLREGAARTRRVLDVPVAGSAVDGALSPGNRLVLLSQLVDDAPVVQVRPLGSDRPLRTFPGAGSGAVWLSERWVAFVGRDGLVLYDAVDDRVVPSRLSGVTRLAWQPA